MSQAKKRLRIGIDFDDVISQTSKPLSKAVSDYFGLEINLYSAQNYELEKTLNISTAEINRAFTQIGSRYSFHKQIPLIKDCKQVLTDIKEQGHTLFVISARRTWELPYSTVWLKFHQILPLVSALIHKPSDSKPEDEYKASIALELELDVFIEDAPHYALAVAGAGIPVVLFDAPYNRTAEFPGNVYRVKGWKEIPQLLTKLQRMTNKKR